MRTRTILLLAVPLVAAALLLAGCLDESGKSICPRKSGSNLCGYCAEDAALSDNPAAGKCRYCPSGSYCSFDDICGELKCRTSGTSGGGSSGGTQKRYYASCSGCDGPQRTYSYNGYSYSTCNYYYRVCVAASCDKILDNCR
jgi:hypothetical protein